MCEKKNKKGANSQEKNTNKQKAKMFFCYYSKGEIYFQIKSKPKTCKNTNSKIKIDLICSQWSEEQFCFLTVGVDFAGVIK